MTHYLPVIGDFLKTIIKESGMRQTDVRNAMGLWNDTFRPILSGKTCV